MTNFELDRYLGVVRQVFPQVNREQTAVQFTNQIEYRIPVVPPVLTTHAYDEVRRRPGLRAKLLRVAGEVFGVRKWYDRGMAIRYIPATYYTERVIELRSFAGPWPYGAPGEQLVIVMGYDPVTDTLFVDPDRTRAYGGLTQ